VSRPDVPKGTPFDSGKSASLFHHGFHVADGGATGWFPAKGDEPLFSDFWTGFPARRPFGIDVVDYFDHIRRYDAATAAG